LDRVLNVGVIGAGYWGPKLARNFHELPGSALAWVCDYRPERRAHLQALYPRARATADYREVLASDVDAVAIATPVRTHHALALEALAAGKHVLVEKPLATSLAEAVEIAETAERLGLCAMVGHTFQHHPAVAAVRELVAGGALGDIYYVNATRANLGLFQHDINVIWDLAPHDLSILAHVLGSQPFEISARGAVYVQRHAAIHDVAYLTLRFPGDVLANLHVSWLDPVKTRRLTIVGSRKMLVYDDIADDKVILYDKGVDVPPYSDTLEEFKLSYRHGPATVVDYAWREPLAVECESLLTWIRGGERSVSDAWAGVQVVRALEAAQRSLDNGGLAQAVDGYAVAG
jgi:predicted dehydrogenase